MWGGRRVEAARAAEHTGQRLVVIVNSNVYMLVRDVVFGIETAFESIIILK